MANEPAQDQNHDDGQQEITDNEDPLQFYGLDPESYTVQRLVSSDQLRRRSI